MWRIPVIETLNENSLHNKLKSIYCPPNAKKECIVGRYVCDILCNDNRIIEIQTCNFRNMKKKLEELLRNHIVEIVYPISVNTYIRTLDNNGNEKGIHLSPLHGSIFQICREISTIKHLINEKNLKIRVVYVESITTKIDDKKGRSRYKKPRIVEKDLSKIINEEFYENTTELLSSILSRLPETFTTENIEKQGYKRRSNYVIWFFKKLNMIIEIGRLGTRKLYKKTWKN